MTGHLIKTLINALPRFAEEEGDFYGVSRDTLISKLTETQGGSLEVAKNTVDLCEALLDSLATLRQDDLQRGDWCFVSFPAQLMALSVLTTLSDPDSRYFEEKFWNKQDVDSSRIECQREVLKIIENRRNDHHTRQQADPVRYIHVAWGLIKHKNNVLFYHREDKDRHEKKSGNYGFPGGRFNQEDFSHDHADMQEKLRILQSSDRALIKPFLINTLQRELGEEIKLTHEQHYSFNHLWTLNPYRQVQGGKSNHALTDYFIEIYAIELTLEGFCLLQQQIAEKKNELIWFSLDELVQGKTSTGKTAYVEALYEHFESKEKLKAAFEKLEDSFQMNYKNCQNPKKYRIVLPREGQKILAGVLGKESAINDFPLDKSTVSLLSGLAVCLRGFYLLEPDPAITLHPYGWVEVREGCELQAELVKLVDLFKDSKDVVIENQKDRWFRLSISPDCVFFDDSYFECSLNKKDIQSRKATIPVTAIRREFSTRLGRVSGEEKETEISRNIAKNIVISLDNSNINKSIYDSLRKSSLHEILSNIGMRGLLRLEGNVVKVCCDFLQD